MKKYFLLTIFSFVISCAPNSGYLGSLGCVASVQDQKIAESLFNSWTTTLSDIPFYKAKELFGCHYVPEAKIYSYKTFVNEKLILVVNGEAVTYVDYYH